MLSSNLRSKDSPVVQSSSPVQQSSPLNRDYRCMHYVLQVLPPVNKKRKVEGKALLVHYALWQNCHFTLLHCRASGQQYEKCEDTR